MCMYPQKLALVDNNKWLKYIIYLWIYNIYFCFNKNLLLTNESKHRLLEGRILGALSLANKITPPPSYIYPFPPIKYLIIYIILSYESF